MQVQLLGQRHVHRNVGRRAAGEEGRNAAFQQAGEHQRIGIAARLAEDDQRIDHQRHEHHRTHQHQQQVQVLLQLRKAIRRQQRAQQQAQDAERRKADHETHHLGHGLGCVVEHRPRVLAGMTERQPQQHAPAQDADVVGLEQRLDRVAHQLHQHILQHHADTARCHLGGVLDPLQRQARREHEAGGHRHQRRREGTHQIQHQDRADVRLGPVLMLRNGRHHQHQNQDRCHRLQRTDKQVTQQYGPSHHVRRPASRQGSGPFDHGVPAFGPPAKMPGHQRHHHGQHQADDDAGHQIQP